jgi:two-component system invasion response regulator UvrY
MKKITILITDDHTLVRESWAFILSNDPRFEVIAECGSGEEAAEMSRQLKPDIVLMDINLPGINGMEATLLVKKYSPGSKIICVSMHTQPAYTRRVMQNGAMGYVTKSSSKEEMITAILEVYNNRKYICNDIKNLLSEQILGEDEKAAGLNSLSAREMDIISHVRKGLSSKEIAALLAISVKTVEVHRYNILKKLNLKNVAALVNYVNNSQLVV